MEIQEFNKTSADLMFKIYHYFAIENHSISVEELHDKYYKKMSYVELTGWLTELANGGWITYKNAVDVSLDSLLVGSTGKGYTFPSRYQYAVKKSNRNTYIVPGVISAIVTLLILLLTK